MEEFQAQAQALSRQMRRLEAYLASSHEAVTILEALESTAHGVEQLHRDLSDSLAAVQTEREAYSDLPQRQETLAAQERDVQTRLANVADREATLPDFEARQTQLQAREADLAEREEEYENRAGEFNTRGAVQAQQAAELHASLEQVGKRKATLDASEADLEKREAAVAERERAAARKTEAQDRRDHMLDGWEDRLEVLRSRITEAEESLAAVQERENQVENCHTLLAFREGDLRRNEEQLQDRSKRLDERERKALAAEIEMGERETSVRTSREAQDELLREGLENVNSRLEEIQLGGSSHLNMAHDYVQLGQAFQQSQKELDTALEEHEELQGKHELLLGQLDEEKNAVRALNDELDTIQGENARLAHETDDAKGALEVMKQDVLSKEELLQKSTEQLAVQSGIAKIHQGELKYYRDFFQLGETVKDSEVLDKLRSHVVADEREVPETPQRPAQVSSAAPVGEGVAASPELGSIIEPQPSEPEGSAEQRQQQEMPPQRQRRTQDFSAWGKFCADVHDFLHSHRPVISADPNGEPSLDQAGQYLVRVAANRRAQDNLAIFVHEASEGEWYCFKRMTQAGHTAPGAQIDYDGPCRFHDEDESCFQVMRGWQEGTLVVQLVWN